MTAAVVVLLLALAPAQLPKEVISEILVHGNHVTSDADVVKLAGITIGEPFGATTIADVTARLKASGKFETVNVMKRLASIEDASRIVVVLVVNEGPVRIEVPKEAQEPARVVRRRGPGNLMYMPILDAEEDLDAYYAEEVIGGPGAFLVVARNLASFAEAIRRKLVHEIAALPAERRGRGQA